MDLLRGSYPGAVGGWLAAMEPGTFWAYHATSGVVQAIGDFWQYFEPVRAAMPQNCTKDVQDVIEYIDSTLPQGNETAKRQLKESFLLGNLEDADFASYVSLENQRMRGQIGHRIPSCLTIRSLTSFLGRSRMDPGPRRSTVLLEGAGRCLCIGSVIILRYGSSRGLVSHPPGKA